MRGDTAIRRHWILVWCAFSFCWLHQRDSAAPSTDPAQPVESVPDAPATPAGASGGENQRPAVRSATPAQRLLAGGPARGAGLVGTLAHALAPLESVVAAAPAPPAADAA